MTCTGPQALDTVYVGPVPEGRHMFVFQVPRRPGLRHTPIVAVVVVVVVPVVVPVSPLQADPPNPDKIPEADLVGVTVVLLTCSYRSAGPPHLTASPPDLLTPHLLPLTPSPQSLSGWVTT